VRGHAGGLVDALLAQLAPTPGHGLADTHPFCIRKRERALGAPPPLVRHARPIRRRHLGIDWAPALDILSAATIRALSQPLLNLREAPFDLIQSFISDFIMRLFNMLIQFIMRLFSILLQFLR